MHQKILVRLALSLLLAPLCAQAAPPETKRTAVIDTYHGVAVSDAYRWLETAGTPDVKAFTQAQNAYARVYLDARPAREAIRERVSEIMSAKTVRHRAVEVRGKQVFALKSAPPKEQLFLVVMPGVDQPEKARVIVDPVTLDATGKTAIDWFVPSPDGKFVAVSLSSGGSESGDVHVFDTATGKDVNDTVPRVNGGTAGGSLAWRPDGKAFYYTRYPRGTERPAADMSFYMQVYLHVRGKPTADDTYELGKELPRIAEIQLAVDESDGRVLATVQKGDGGEFAFFVRGASKGPGSWTQIADFPDRIVQGVLAPKNSLFLISRQGAPRGKLLHLSLDAPVGAAGETQAVRLARARELVPEGAETLVSDFWDPRVMVATRSRIYLTYQLGGPSEVRVFEHTGRALSKPPQPEVATVGGVTRLAGDDMLFAINAYTTPPSWWVYDAKKGKSRATKLAVQSPVNFDDAEVVREFAVSADGTKVPVNIIRPKGVALDGSHPTLVTGYGGYGISITPSFTASDRALFEQGVILAEVNLRGGGEYGTEWHDQGRLTKKQNVFDDFAAAVKHMAARGYTKPERTIIVGGSNGGLLMGATLTQHPELVRAVVSYVGMYDMLRCELSPNGEFNIPEFGTVKDPAQFKALHAYSPYHRVADGTRYPNILLLTGENDPRVDPAESRKMAARLQAASPLSMTLLRTNANTGHGQGTALSDQIEETVDVFAFVFSELGVQYKAPGAQKGSP